MTKHTWILSICAIGLGGCGKASCDEFADLVCACDGDLWDCEGARQTAQLADDDDVAQDACQDRLNQFESDGGCGESPPPPGSEENSDTGDAADTGMTSEQSVCIVRG